MGVTIGVLCSACTNESLEIQLESPVHRAASEVEAVQGGDSRSQREKATTPKNNGDLSRPDISAREGISRRASAASTVADPPQQGEASLQVYEATEVSTSSDVEISDGWADWTLAATLCESHQQPAEQQRCSQELNLGSLAPDVPEVLPRFASLEDWAQRARRQAPRVKHQASQPSRIGAERSPSQLPPQSRSVGTQAPEGLPELAPTARTSTVEPQRPQAESQQQLQQELQRAPEQEPLPLPHRAWPLQPSVGTWLVPHVHRIRSQSTAATSELEAAADAAAAATKTETTEADAAPSMDDRPQGTEASLLRVPASSPIMAWHALPSVGTWLHQLPRHRSKGVHLAPSASVVLPAKDSAEVVQDVEELKKRILDNMMGIKPAYRELKVDSLLAFDPYAPCADDGLGESFHGNKNSNDNDNNGGQEECPVS